MASIAGIVKFYSDRSRTQLDIQLNAQAAWTLKVRLLGMLVHLLFEVAGGTSLFTMILVYTMGSNRSTDAVNSIHFVAFIGMFLELCLSTLRVRFDQFPACVAFLVFYFLVIWPGVFTGVIADWPYPEMSTRTQSCFRNYFVAFLFNFLLYTGWYLLYKTKKLLMVLRQRMIYGDPDDHNSEMERQFAEDTSAQGDLSSEQSSNYGGDVVSFNHNIYPPMPPPRAYPQQHNPFYAGPPPQTQHNPFFRGPPPPYPHRQQQQGWQQPPGGYGNGQQGRQQMGSTGGSAFNDDTLDQFAFGGAGASSYSSQTY